MEGQITQHRYSPLDADRKEIRLLHVSQRSQHLPRDDPIRYTVEHVSLLSDPCPVYETVSYVWGDQENRSIIYVDDELVEVHASAEQTLRCARLHAGSKDRRLWIDAVCIDSANINERREQVSMMGNIYRASASNLIHIGEDDGLVGRAFLDFRILLQEARIQTDDFRHFFRTVFKMDDDNWQH